MRKLIYVTLSLVLFARLAGAGSPATVALVSRIEGSATLRPASGAPSVPLAPFQRLVLGDVLATAPGAAVTLAFLDGRRQVLLSRSRATVQAGGLHPETGRVRPLTNVPVIADLAPLLREGEARPRAAAIPIRGGGGSSADWKLREARQALAWEADRLGEPDLRLLLAEVDRRLGPEPRP